MGQPRYILFIIIISQFAGTSLWFAGNAIGHRPLLVDLESVNDTDHVIAVFKERGLWGAIAKSNYAFLEYREPIHRQPAMAAFADVELPATDELARTHLALPVSARLPNARSRSRIECVAGAAEATLHVRFRGETESARPYFAAATSYAESRVKDDPNSAERRDALALLYAYAQRKEDAIREARRAVELEPESLNAFHGTAHAATLALVYALNGEPGQAMCRGRSRSRLCMSGI